MKKRTALAAVLVTGAGTAAFVALDGAAARDARPGQGARLERFAGCGDLLDYMKGNATRGVTAWGFLGRLGETAVGRSDPTPGPVAIPGVAAPTPRPSESTRRTPEPEPEFSTTNVQEAGVDEPDLVKSNGASLFALAGDKVHSVDVAGERPRRLDSLALLESGAHQLLLRGDTLLVLTSDAPDVRLERGPGRTPPATALLPPPAPSPKSTLTQIDVSKPGSMRVVRRLSFEGRYLSARLVRGSVRVVFTSSVPDELRFAQARSLRFPDEALAHNRAVIANSKAANWLPSFEIRNVRTKARKTRSVQCRHVSRPPEFSGFGMLTVLTIDLDRGLEPVESDSILGDGDIVYASDKSLYVATQRWTGQEVGVVPRTPPRLATSLHKFDISPPTRTAYRSSGVVSGSLLNQWALSEHEGVLRAATTEFPTWWDGQSGESAVTTLEERGGKLVQLGRAGGLGRGERIFGVRFIGDVGYVVTFRQIDPLYTLDLSSPARPRLLGELKIPGYSAYLHPAGNDLLLGLGQDATDEGTTVGTQLSVFDVSDLRKPVRLHRRTIEGASSEAESDHHAFLYWRPARLAVVPVQTVSRGHAFQGAIGFRVGRERLEEVGRIVHEREGPPSARARRSGSIRRVFVVKDRLLTVSDAGVRASDLKTFADRSWAGFG